MEHKNKRLPIFTERFRELQGDKSNTDFASFLGISRQTVGFYCNGERLPDALSLIQIAEKCQVSADWLLGLSKEKSYEADIQKVCNYTGLSASAVSNLAKSKGRHPQTEVQSFLFERTKLINYIVNYFSGFALKGILKPPYKYIPIKANSLYPFMGDVHFAAAIRALQSSRIEFESLYKDDELFEERAIYGFLRKHADVAACERIVWGDELNNYLTDEEMEEINRAQFDDERMWLEDHEHEDWDIVEYEDEREEEYDTVASFLNSLRQE